MLSFICATLLISISTSGVLAKPIRLSRRATLDPAAVAEAQQRDNTATRAFSAVPITTGDGSCLFVDPESGDFRENLIPVQTKPCDGSAAQQWDVITSGKHNDRPGTALVVSALTQGCLNFDPRRAAGNQVLLFSCGGRADGGGQVTDSQLFAFGGSAGPQPLLPQNGKNATCLTVKNGVLDQSSCNAASASSDELFTFGSSSSGAPPPPKASSSAQAKPSAPPSSGAGTAVTKTVVVTSTSIVSQCGAPTSAAASTVAASPPAAPTSNPAIKTGVKLDQTAVAEAMQRDNTATRAVSGGSIKTSDGTCLFVDPTSGDFRENLIPIQTAPCDGSDAQKWDIITKGKHNDQPGTALIVSALTQGCLNFDPRRAAGNQVLLFSCGGRADGEGRVTDSQLFPFSGKTNGIPLAPQSGKNQTCLQVAKNGLLDQAGCNGGKAQLFTIGG